MAAAAANSGEREAEWTTEQELLAAARAGNADAVEELVRLYQAPVYRAALAALGSPADAEEAAQDAFVSAFRRIGTFRGESSFKTWLVSIAWRKALTRRRRLQWLRFRSATRPVEADGDPLDRVAHSGADPQVEALGRDLRARLRGLIRSLPGKLRDPLLLVAGGDYTYEDVAAVLNIPVGTAKWRVSEARRVLREKLARLGYDT
jgi:RNA polymerase sigma-70 factor (ECF subfamily)